MEITREAGWSPQRICRATEVSEITFKANFERCPVCGDKLTVLKSKRRTVTTLAHKKFSAHEIILQCRSGAHQTPLVFRSDALLHIVAPGKRFGWDLVVHVGMQRYQHLRQREEIRRDLLSNHGIEISTGTISAMCDLFLQRLEALHIDRAPKLAKALAGGYALHIDSTNESGKGGLFVCFEGLRGLVLGSAKIVTENAADIKPIINKVVDLFGDPIAVVRDMGKPGKAAIKELAERGVPDFICHFHFIADVGKDILSKPYSILEARLSLARVTDSLKKLLRSLKTSSDRRYTEPPLAALIYWLLNGKGRSVPSFPFGLPAYDLLRRIQKVNLVINAHLPKPWSSTTQDLVKRLEAIVSRVEEDPIIDKTALDIQRRKHLLDDLRRFLRLESKPSRLTQPLLPAFEADVAVQINDGIDQYIEKLERRCPKPKSRYTDTNPRSIIVTHLKRYKDNLVGHPVITDQPGNIIGVVPRTNNVLERFFGTCRQHLRRRTGRKLVRRDLDEMPPQATLVENLRNSSYVKVLCGSLRNLPEALATVTNIPSPLDQLRSHPDTPMRKAASAISSLKVLDEVA
jgi:hypothetical protein